MWRHEGNQHPIMAKAVLLLIAGQCATGLPIDKEKSKRHRPASCRVRTANQEDINAYTWQSIVTAIARESNGRGSPSHGGCGASLPLWLVRSRDDVSVV